MKEVLKLHAYAYNNTYACPNWMAFSTTPMQNVLFFPYVCSAICKPGIRLEVICTAEYICLVSISTSQVISNINHSVYLATW